MVMKKTNALQMRRSLGKVLSGLERGGEPVLVERNRQPVAVLIAFDDYQERFVDKVAAERREELARDILATRRRAKKSRSKAVDLLRAVRGPLP